MKKILSIICATALTITTIPSVMAEESKTYKENGVEYEYILSGNDAVITNAKYGDTKEAIIPSEIDGHEVVEIRNAKGTGIDYGSSKETVKKITVSEGVKKIGYYAFSNMPELRSVELPEGLETIEEGAFSESKSLRSVHLPSTLKYIGKECFSKTSLSDEITIPDNVNYIGEQAFAFNFIKEVNWDMTADTIEGQIFRGTPYLLNYGEDFLLFNNGTLLQSYCGKEKSVTIPEGVTEISDFAFPREMVEEVTYPKSMKTIKDVSNHNENIKKITISEGTEEIGERAFVGYEKLEEINLPSSLKRIEKDAFSSCTALKVIEFPEGLEYIGHAAFCYDNIEEITIPKSVQTIKSLAFCCDLKRVTFLGEPTMEKHVFDDTLTEVNGLTDEYILKNWGAYRTSKFAENYKSNGMDFVINNGVLEGYIGSKTDIVIPEGVTEIYTEVFQNKPITSVKFPSTLKVIGSLSFENTKIKEVTIPANVEEIKGYAFGMCENLTKVTIEPSKHIVTVSDAAFAESNVSNIKFPDNVKFKASVIIEEPNETISPKPESTLSPTSAPTASPVPQTLIVEGGEEIAVKVNGTAVKFPDAKPFIDGNDRTQVPVRAVAEMLDCKVDWDGEIQTVTITKNGEVITLIIGEDVMSKNGEQVKMDTKAIIKDERTYIPVRFIAEALGLIVDYK